MEQEQFDFLEDIEIDKPDVEFQKWKDQKREAKSRMIAMQYQPYEPVDSIIPDIYGDVVQDQCGNLRTTGAQRTGCSMCGFGIHMEKRPHRFDKLRERNQKEWEYYMYRCCTDPETGEKYGWGRVLDYIGVPWEDYPAIQMELPLDQMM